MEKKLLLLGMLRMQGMHGYQLNEFIDSHLGPSVQLTKPTAYNLLNKMAEDGWISFRDEQQGNRPSRRVYALTDKGEQAFQKTLRECLADYRPGEFQSDIALAFIETVPAAEAVALLETRRRAIQALMEPFQRFGGDHHQGGFQLMIEHQMAHLSAEVAWVDQVIARLAKEGKT